MKQLQAHERLVDPEYGGKLNAAQFHELLIEAGFGKDAAQKAANERGNSRMDAGLPQ